MKSDEIVVRGREIPSLLHAARLKTMKLVCIICCSKKPRAKVICHMVIGKKCIILFSARFLVILETIYLKALAKLSEFIHFHIKIK